MCVSGEQIMSELTITRAVPNPAGKDRTASNMVRNEQLNNEWIEFANTSQRTLSLDGIALSHYTFEKSCSKTGEDGLAVFNGSLQAGYSIRVHTGTGTAWDEGSIRHLYAARGNFAWNNRCGDTSVLRNSRGEVVDWATYDPNPPEGVVLNRVPGTNKLQAVPATRTA
jgi:predicted extracellular nuclease